MNESLQLLFLSEEEISEEVTKKINELDHLAFSEDQNDPILGNIEWSDHEWMALGFLGEELVTQLCILKREIKVKEQPLLVTGVGGVATKPQWKKHGFATQLLRASETFMRDSIQVPFGLLICAEETQPVYKHCGWQTVAQSLFYVQNDKKCSLDTCVMILPLSTQTWPMGEIDLCGHPW
jgi:aminoglycoside 2'-N-acetyltransferase I